jgi:hypothetical protein
MVMGAAGAFGRFADAFQRNIAPRFNDPTDQPPGFEASLQRTEEIEKQKQVRPSVKDREKLQKLIPVAVDFRNRGQNEEEGRKAIEELSKIPGGIQALDTIAASAISQNANIMKEEAPRGVGPTIARDISRVGRDFGNINRPIVSVEQARDFDPPGGRLPAGVSNVLQKGFRAIMPLASEAMPETEQERAEFISSMTQPSDLAINLAFARLGGRGTQEALGSLARSAPIGLSQAIRGFRAVTRPITETPEGFRGFTTRMGQEAAIQAGATLGAQEATRRTQDQPAYVRIPSQILGTVVGGAQGLGTAAGIGNLVNPNILRMTPDAIVPSRPELPEPGPTGGRFVVNPQGTILDLFNLENRAKTDTGYIKVFRQADEANPNWRFSQAPGQQQTAAGQTIPGQTADIVPAPPKPVNVLGEDTNYKTYKPETKTVNWQPLQDFEELNRLNFIENSARVLGTTIAGTPGFNKISGLFNPALKAINDGRQLAITYASQINQINLRITQAFIPVQKLGASTDIFQSPKGFDPQGRFIEGPFRGQTLNDIVENLPKLKNTLNETQIEYIQKLNALDKSATERARALGKDIRLVSEEDNVYATRKTIGRIVDGELVDVKNVDVADNGELLLDISEKGVIKTQPYITTEVGAAKQRGYKTTQEALDDGYVILPYEDAVRAKMEQVYRLEAAYNLQQALNSRLRKLDPDGKLELKGELGSAEDQAVLIKLNVERATSEQLAFFNDLRGGILDYQKTVSPFFTDNALAKGLNNVNYVGRTVNLSFDGSLMGIQLASGINRDLLFNASLRNPLKNKGLILGPRKGEKLILPAALKGFAETLWQGLKNPQNALDMQARYFAKNKEVILEMDRLELFATKNVAEMLEGSAILIGTRNKFKSVDSSLIGIIKNNLQEKFRRVAIPFQEAWTASMNIAKIEMYKNLRHNFVDANGIVNIPKKIEVEDHINNVSGTISSARLGISPKQRYAESFMALAPRYTRATIGLLVDAVQGGLPLFRERGIRGPGGKRIPYLTTATRGSTRGRLAQEAIASNMIVFGFIGYANLLAQTLDEHGGKKNLMDIMAKRTKDYWNPMSGRFYMTELGGNLVGAGGKVIQLLKINSKILDKVVRSIWDAGGLGPDDDIGIQDPEVAKSILTDIRRFLRGNSSHTVQSGLELITAEDYMGKELYGLGGRKFNEMEDKRFWNTAEAVTDSILPIWIGTMVFDGGSLGTRVGRGLADFFGYKAYGETKSFRQDKIAQNSPYDVTSWADLDIQQKDAITKNLSAEDRQFLIEAEEEEIARGNPYAIYRRSKQEFEDDLQQYTERQFDFFKETIAEKNYTVNEIKKAFNRFENNVSIEKASTYDRIRDERKDLGIDDYSGEENPKDFDRIYNDYLGLWDKYSKTTLNDKGETVVIDDTADYDRLNQAQELFLSRLSDTNRAKLQLYLNRNEIDTQAQQILDLKQPISTAPLRFRSSNQLARDVMRILNLR